MFEVAVFFCYQIEGKRNRNVLGLNRGKYVAVDVHVPDEPRSKKKLHGRDISAL